MKPNPYIPDTYINGLPLPYYLLILMKTGRWKCPKDMTAVSRIFPEHGTDFLLYELGTMQRETASFRDEKDTVWFGVPNAVKSPGDIDPDLSVLIADLGSGYDQPIALDYRHSVDSPKVLLLEWLPNPIGENLFPKSSWTEIAPDIQTFAGLLGL
jgi:hypothetical protein